MASRGPSTQLIVTLVSGMLITGCSNSLWSKWQDMQCVSNCASGSPDRKNFEQPVWQTATMFLGETLCLLAFLFLASKLNPFRPATRSSASAAARRAALAAPRIQTGPLSRPDESAIFFNESDISLHNEGNFDAPDDPYAKAGGNELEGWQKAALFWGPSCCDIAGTTAMNVGLLFVPVSIYQMLRGALVLWVGVFSVIFLGRRLSRAQWAALATVMAGVAVVGVSSVGGAKKELQTFISEAGEEVDPMVGVILILVAQLFTASQFVMEERIMDRYSVEPLLAVGYEGAFGLATTLVAMPVLYFFVGSTPAGKGGYFDAPEGWNQIVSNPTVWGSSIMIAISIAFFNFCGLAVTKSLSATARSTIDTCRTLGIWVFSLWLGWEQFKWLQVIGFSLLVYGTFIFNGITTFPVWTGLHTIEVIPTIVIDSEEDEDSETDVEGMSRSRDAIPRPLARRSGSGRRGEASPLLKSVD